jgi:vitamin B12 transporter
MRRQLPVLFLLIFTALAGFGQQPIGGVVRDSSGAVVPKASVRLSTVTGTVQRYAETADSGSFRFENVSPGPLLLTVEAGEFERVVKPVDSAGGKSGDLEVLLPLQALPQQVSVTANSYLEDLDDSTRATAVIGRSEIDRRLEYSVTDALRESPGVRVTQLGGPGSTSTIRLRGLRAQDTSVLIDGMRMRDPASTQADAQAFTGDLMTLNISRIEVMRGCGSALYGSNAIGGVVNIVSDSGGGKFRGDWLGEGGGLGFLRSQLRMSGGALKDRLMYSGGVSHVNVLEGVDGDDRARNSSAQGFLQYRVRDSFLISGRVHGTNSFVSVNQSPALTANAPRTGSVNAIPLPDSQVDLRQRGLPFTLGNATVFPSTNDPDSRRATWFTSALVAVDGQIAPPVHYRMAYQLVDARRDFPNGPAGIGFQPVLGEISTFRGRTDTLQARLNWTGSRHIFSGGYEWEREAFDNGGVSQNPAPAIATSYRAQVSQRSQAAFAEDRWRFLQSRLQVTLSGRVQHFALQSPTLTGGLAQYLATPVPTPPNAYTGDIAAMYRVERTNTKFRAHLGNAYRAPSLFERYGTTFFGGAFIPYGDPRLRSERSIGTDAGVDQYLAGRRARVSATYFYTELRSVIAFDSTGLINRTADPFGRTSGYFATAGGLARGIELEGQAALWRGFQVTGSYTHTRTLERRMIAAGTLKTPRILEHTVSFVASQTWHRWVVSANFFGSPDFIGVISGRAINWPGPRRLDGVVSYRLTNSERIKPEFFVRAENVLNQAYYEDGFRTPRRWVVGGLRLSF